ncbi:MAG: hypothetical protein ACI9QV_000798, partial [Methylophagaceae bacterium]
CPHSKKICFLQQTNPQFPTNNNPINRQSLAFTRDTLHKIS